VAPEAVQEGQEGDAFGRQAVRDEPVAVALPVDDDVRAGVDDQAVPQADRRGKPHALVRVEVVQRVDDRHAATAQRIDERDVPGMDAGEMKD